MGKQTNGEMFLPINLLSIAEKLEDSEQVKTISYEERVYKELIDFKWLFSLI